MATAASTFRSGLPGFIGIEGKRLRIPGFAGNRYFSTLGNFLLHPLAALLFIDFAPGDLLHLTGVAAVDWASAARPPVAGSVLDGGCADGMALAGRLALPLVPARMGAKHADNWHGHGRVAMRNGRTR
jgi:hypothetical protein